MTDEFFRLVAFIATLTAIVLLSKIGGTGSDLAIMTGLVGVLGGLAAGRMSPDKQKVEVVNPPSDPVPVEPKDPLP